MGALNPKVLLVEGDEDMRVIPHLMEANGVAWGERNEPKVVQIEPYDGVEKMLVPGQIETWLRQRGLQALGILVDADTNAAGRWAAIRNRCATTFPDLPTELPESGVFATNAAGLRLGVWIMPNNRSAGILETFLANMRPTGNPELWQHTQEAVTQARTRGARVTDAHVDKARVHTWLAWEEPPGLQLHLAVIARLLDPKSPSASLFVRWFKTVFSL